MLLEHYTALEKFLYRPGRPLITPLTGNEPHAADIQTLESAWRTLRQVRVDAGSECTRPSEFRLIKSLEGFEKLETLTMSTETVYKSKYPKDPKNRFNRGHCLMELSST
jgi:hypothetical protein